MVFGVWGNVSEDLDSGLLLTTEALLMTDLG